ncbi:dihydrofolate reductase family protein [Algoriphagus aestuariicola]|jgi:dihydrofolate reductase|uniref:Dihydrofolate reductase family protein n=1 Tax=Algoriphagus aestuariicola TaxID=1852016 RepID=A0ABS3BNF0_9BACT|nr:dihydrofolate reductase family protein [Algoriphagus aestuariicola]MBN7800431.1 dihydrofolate reductase family protein [Algoriphagus aestuariicola]
MPNIIAAFNLTVDGFCDHTAINPDKEIHEHYRVLLGQAGIILYGRTTYELMEFWRTLVENPSGEKSMDEFALAMDKVPKLVFSNTLKKLDWHSAILANKSLKESVLELKRAQTYGEKDILVGCRSLIIQLLNLNLIDELQLCIHPVVVGKGLPLFDQIDDRKEFKLLKTKIFSSGAVLHYYEPSTEK